MSPLQPCKALVKRVRDTFKQESKEITVDSVMKMNGGKVGIVMMGFKKEKKNLNTFFSIKASREIHLHKRNLTGEGTAEEEHNTERAWENGEVSALGEDRSLCCL